nr:MAG TPA: hypothetical protein [Caudoviricetes sp.]
MNTSLKLRQLFMAEKFAMLSTIRSSNAIRMSVMRKL